MDITTLMPGTPLRIWDTKRKQFAVARFVRTMRRGKCGPRAWVEKFEGRWVEKPIEVSHIISVMGEPKPHDQEKENSMTEAPEAAPEAVPEAVPEETAEQSPRNEIEEAIAQMFATWEAQGFHYSEE